MASITVDGDRRLAKSARSLQSTSARTVWSVHNQARPGPDPPSLHGPISAYEHPNAANRLARGATADDIIGNRVYAAWGVGDDGVLTILDRKKLLPPLSNGRGGTYAGDPDQPTVLLEASLARDPLHVA